jgi:nucleotide-binding universal stress UspA family protein
MLNEHATRVLVVTDTATPDHTLLDAIRERAGASACQFRVIVTNPARAELHLLHPERHDKAQEAELVLRQALPLLERAAGGPVIGTVSVRNDPMDAIEETIFSEPIDEIMIAVAPHGLSTWLHQDLAHRLQHFALPVTTVTAGTAAR